MDRQLKAEDIEVGQVIYVMTNWKPSKRYYCGPTDQGFLLAFNEDMERKYFVSYVFAYATLEDLLDQWEASVITSAQDSLKQMKETITESQMIRRDGLPNN